MQSDEGNVCIGMPQQQQTYSFGYSLSEKEKDLALHLTPATTVGNAASDSLRESVPLEMNFSVPSYQAQTQVGITAPIPFSMSPTAQPEKIPQSIVAPIPMSTSRMPLNTPPIHTSSYQPYLAYGAPPGLNPPPQISNSNTFASSIPPPPMGYTSSSTAPSQTIFSPPIPPIPQQMGTQIQPSFLNTSAIGLQHSHQISSVNVPTAPAVPMPPSQSIGIFVSRFCVHSQAYYLNVFKYFKALLHPFISHNNHYNKHQSQRLHIHLLVQDHLI